MTAFFDLLYPNGLPPGQWLLVWTLPDKTSYWANSIDQANAFVEANKASADMYFGVGLSPNPETLAGLAQNKHLRKVRVTNAEVTGIPGLWLDLDYKDDRAHKKQNLPEKQEAYDFLKDYESEPTVIIHSGHGWQAYWLFEEPWLFTNASDRTNAGNLARSFIYKFRDKMRQRGYDVDSVIDLARVLRVPGTTNYKQHDKPVPVEIDRTSGPRWRVSTLINTYPPLQAQRGATGSTVPSGAKLLLDPNANPPFEAWEALREAEPRAAASWRRERADLADQSASSYDLSLATFAVNAGWSDQETTDLLIAFRRKHAEDLKIDREDYYPRTIARARTKTSYTTTTVSDVSTLSARESQAVITNILDLQIVCLTKFMADPPVYSLRLIHNGEEREVTLGSVEAILGQRTFRNRIASAINRIVPKQKDSEWEKTAQALLNMLVEEALPESTPAEMAKAWVEEYLSETRPSEDFEAAAMLARPFVKDGKTYIVLRGMVQWLRIARGEKTNNRELARYLNQAGAKSETIYIGADQERKPTTRYAFDVTAFAP